MASLACGLSWSLPTLVGARVIQGVGAAMITSGNTALIRFIYPPGRLGRGINVPAGMFAVVLAWRNLPRIAHSPRASGIQATLLCMGFLGLLVLGMGGFSHHDDWRLPALELGISAACGFALLRRQADHPAPLLAVDLFGGPSSHCLR